MLKIYLTDLEAYNNGALVGKWIELPMSQDELSQELKEVLEQGKQAVNGYNHEEYFITDYEWEDVSIFEVGEYANLTNLNEQVEQLEELNQEQQKAVQFLLDEQLVKDMAEAIEKVDDVIIYQDQSMSDIAYNLIEECYNIDNIPSIISNHIDYKAIGDDLLLDGSYFVGNDGDIIQYVA